MKPELKTRYLDTGKAKLVWRHFIALGGSSNLAAQASACAHARGKFWPYHDYLYAAQKSAGVAGAVSWSSLMTGATEVGMDTTEMQVCLAEQTFLRPVSNDHQSGLDQGVIGTPTFFINGRQVVGSPPWAVWVQTMEAALSGVTR